jgi:serralysin
VSDILGHSTLDGGAGDDTFKGSGGPRSPSRWPDVNGTAGQDVLVGNGESNILRGQAGQDNLIGGGGADIMYGGTDSDHFYVDNAGDVVREYVGEGTFSMLMNCACGVSRPAQ